MKQKKDATYSSLFLQLSSCRTSILLIVSRLFLSRLDSVTDGGGMIVGIEDDEGTGKRDIVVCLCSSLLLLLLL
jgi:hypothetical protein